MKINDNGVDRDMTAQEIVKYQAIAETMQAEDEVRQAEVAARATARAALLARLGLTEEEAQLLIGGI